MEGSTQDKAQVEGPQVLYTNAKTTEKVAAANTFFQLKAWFRGRCPARL